MRRLMQDADRIFIVFGATDFRKQIPGLVALVNIQFKLDPYQGNHVFIFCNEKKDSIKVLRYDSNGFILATKKLLDDLKFQWPRTPEEVKEITFRQMENERVPISNNLCEANIKPFATARRAWLFADTPKEVAANTVLYTLVESARANGLDVY